MSKFKVGDKVRIKEELEVGSLDFIEDMNKYSGQTAEITGVIDDECYRLDVDNNYWVWADWMLDKLPTRGRPKGAKNQAKKVIEVSKCPKTVTGNHAWSSPQRGQWSTPNIFYLPKCIYCGIVDDREVKL